MPMCSRLIPIRCGGIGVTLPGRRGIGTVGTGGGHTMRGADIGETRGGDGAIRIFMLMFLPVPLGIYAEIQTTVMA